MRTPEGYEKDKIKKHLAFIGAWFCLPYMAGFGKSGVPDILVCYRGAFVSIEVKREGKKPTVLQQRRMEEISSAGGYALWGTADKVIAAIEHLRGSYKI